MFWLQLGNLLYLKYISFCFFLVGFFICKIRSNMISLISKAQTTMKVIHQILRPCRLWSVPEIWVFGLQHQLAHTFFVALDRHISKLQFERRFGKIMLEFCFRAYLFGFAVKEWWSKMKEESNFCIVRIHASIWSSLLFHCEFIWAVLNV